MDLKSVTDALYDAPLGDFIQRRDVQVAEAKAAGNTELAAEIKSLRRPSVGAWLVNLLVRRFREDVDTLLAMAGKLRSAHDLDGEELRGLLASRRETEARLLDAAREIAADHDQKLGQPALGEVRASFEAALADPQAAELILSGQLVKALGYGDYSDALAAPGVRRKPVPTRSAVAVAPPPAKVRVAKERLAKAERHAERTAAKVEAADRDRGEAEAHAQATRDDVADLERFLRNRQSDLKMAERNLATADRVRIAAKQKADDAAAQLAAAQAAVAELS